MKIVVIGCTLSTKRLINEILKNKNYTISAIFTLKDGLSYTKSRFVLLDDIAGRNKIRLFKIDNINNPKTIASLKNLHPDLILEVGWSQIISKKIIEIPKKGCIGIHYSYLPKNQGGASLNWALIKNEKNWGVTLFYLTDKVDRGDIIDRRKFIIEERDNINTLFDKADLLVAEMLSKNLPQIDSGKVLKMKQNKQKASYLPKRIPQDGKIDWGKSSLEIHNLIRALTRPYPGAFTYLNDNKVLIWQSELADRRRNDVGKVIKILKGKGIIVGTGKGRILLKRLQFENGIEMWADQFATKCGLKKGDSFDQYSEVNKSIVRAQYWLLYSGIQNITGSAKTYGSFNSWFDSESKNFPFAYSEITGYGITTFLFLKSRFPKLSRILVSKAQLAADWLIVKAFEKNFGGINCRFDQTFKTFDNKICVFDNGMCLNAFVNLFKETNKRIYLDFSIKIADWILSMQKSDGSFYTRFSIDNYKLEEKGDKWSKQSGSFHAKIGVGLLNLGLLLREDKYIKSAKRICEFALKFQEPNGRFVTDANTKDTFLHPACYSAEGLIAAAIVFKNKKYTNSVKKFIEWIFKNRLKTGGFPAYFSKGDFITVESPEMNSQVLRLLFILKAMGEYIDIKDKLSVSINNILRYQSKIKSKKTYGGFYSGDAWFHMEKNKGGLHINSWVTMFIIQMLLLYEQAFNLDEIFYLV